MTMNGKLLKFDANEERYRFLSDEYADKGDFETALGLSFSALKKDFSLDLIMDIADTYADMGLYELSNQYWFIYMDKAPKNKVSIAYEELAINFYYMDNVWAAGFYFHLKLSEDGFISREGLDREIVDFFSGEQAGRRMFKTVYPPEKSDWTFEIKAGKLALIAGDFKTADKYFGLVPEGAPQYFEALDEYSTSNFLAGRIDEAIESSRKLTGYDKGKITGYCNLSSMFRYKGDNEKSEYYYRKALEQTVSDIGETYKLATCSLDMGQHGNAIVYLEKIITERPYELNLKYLYGVALLNVGRYEKGYEVLSALYRTDPTDLKFKYYARLSRLLAEGDVRAKSFLPLGYDDDLPPRVTKNYLDNLGKLFSSTTEQINRALKKETVRDALDWALSYGNKDAINQAAYILASSTSAVSDGIMTAKLMDQRISDSVKRILIYMLIVKGFRGKFGFVSGNFYKKLKCRKMKCESEGGELFFTAYALAVSRLAFFDADDLDKLASTADKLYIESVNRGKHRDYGIFNNREEIAALITLKSNLKRFSSIKEVAEIFNVNEAAFRKFIEEYDGEKND